MYRPQYVIRRKSAYPGSNAAHYPSSPLVLLPPAGTLPLWYDAQNINLLNNVGINDGDPIGTWKNAGIVGVPGDLIQGTALNKPTFKKLGLIGKLNGLSTVNFAGANWIGVAAGLTINQPDLIAIVLKATMSNGFVAYQPSAGAQQLSQAAGPVWHLFAGTDQDTTGSASLNVYHAVLTTWNGASTVFRTDDAANVVGNPGIANGTGFTLGANPVGGTPMTGEIVECLVYTGVLPTTASVEAYFNAKYGAGWPQ